MAVAQFKFGLNARLRNKTGDQTSWSVNQVPNVSLTSAVNGPNIVYYQGHYPNGPQIDASVLRSIYAAQLAAGNLLGDPVGDALFAVHDKENVYAAYGQYEFGFGPLGMVAGVRVERTDATYAGFASDTSGSASSAGCPILDAGPPPAHVCPVANNRNYTNVFPSVQVRYELQQDLIARGALSSTIARPGFQQVTASTTIDTGGNISTGNPNLEPTTATGLDLALEKYLPHAGIASLGFFAKDIKNYIFKNVAQQAGGPQKAEGNKGVIDIVGFANAATSHLYGFEANYVQHFRDELPGALAGLGVSVNWTWVDSWYREPVIDPTTNLVTGLRTSILPSTSRNTGNFELLYDQYGVDLTLGAYYTSKNIFGVGNTAALDIWTQERLSLDFGSQYQVTEAFSVYFNAKNLTNTPLKFTEGPGENRVIQREFYDLTLQFGGTLKF